jgi:hypothetical protein
VLAAQVELGGWPKRSRRWQRSNRRRISLVTPGMVMITGRHAMLATVRGGLGVLRLAERVLESGRRAGLADTADLYGALRGMVLLEQGKHSRRRPS